MPSAGALNPEKFRVIHRLNLAEAEPFAVRGIVDACIIDVELTSPQGIWVLEKASADSPSSPAHRL
jgi:hypothetical protein